MTGLDWIIVGFVLTFALWGYAQGFIVGALSLAGFGAGAVLGTHVGPALLPDGSASPYAPLFGLLGALLAGGILATGLEGVGIHLRGRVRVPLLGAIDGLLGALLTGCVALGIAWIGGAVALQTPGTTELRHAIQRSALLQRLNEALPPSGAILHALARFDPLPRVAGPQAKVGPPTAAIARDPQVRADAPSVVRIQGSACGLGVEGSGWVAAPQTVVTNAHVIAGQGDTTVQAGGGGPRLSGLAIWFDATNDLAILRVPGLDRRPLTLAPDSAPGTPAAILGFPLNGPYVVEPGRVGQTQTVVSEDAYGNGPVARRMVSLRGLVRSGNSGGPMVDGSGRVVATIFAAIVDAGAPPGGFGVPDAVVREALDRARGAVGTGPCAR